MYSKNMVNSIITNLPSEIIQFPFFELMDNLSYEEIQQVKQNLNMYPPDDILISTYIENLCWKDFKGMISKRKEVSKTLKQVKSTGNIFRNNIMPNDIPSGNRISSTLGIMSSLTNLLSNDILDLKKKNQEERRAFSKKMSDKNMIKHMKKLKHQRNKLPSITNTARKSKKTERLKFKFFQELEMKKNAKREKQKKQKMASLNGHDNETDEVTRALENYKLQYGYKDFIKKNKSKKQVYSMRQKKYDAEQRFKQSALGKYKEDLTLPRINKLSKSRGEFKGVKSVDGFGGLGFKQRRVQTEY